MAVDPLTNWRRPGVWPVLIFLIGVMIALHLLTDAVQGSEQLSHIFVPLLVIVLLGLVVLAVLLATSIIKLVSRYRRQVLGSRLTARLVFLFVVIAFVPVAVVYYYSRNFLLYGIDSWFDVKLDQAMRDSLALNKASLAVNQRFLLKYTQHLLDEISIEVESNLNLSLVRLRDSSGAQELTLLNDTGQLLAFSSEDPTSLVPDLPDKEVMKQTLYGHQYTDLYPHSDNELWIRVLVKNEQRQLLLQALFPTSEHVSRLSIKVEDAYNRYRELAYLRQSLKFNFTLALLLVVIYSLMAAIIAAFHSARRLVAPVADIAQGTRAVIAGDFTTLLPVPHHDDELRVLVASFNDMIRQLAWARDSATRSQDLVETQRNYLETILERLSNGVIAIGADFNLRTANGAAQTILNIDLNPYLGRSLTSLAIQHERLGPLIEALQNNIKHGREWRQELTLFGSEGRQILLCRSTPFTHSKTQRGHVLVFDDVTTLIQAQRDAAWAEVARRLAHEIKNPLTPIQLSAERLRRKCLHRMVDEDKNIMDRSTQTIIQQVEAMKTMVNEFADYARSVKMQSNPILIDQLVENVIELYQGGQDSGQIQAILNAPGIHIKGDPLRLRQVLHNLLKNAQEATIGQEDTAILVLTSGHIEGSNCCVEIKIQDNGPGLSEQIIASMFEPYVTTKSRGTGLGLAIVKKIIEEHGGVIWAENIPTGGACVTIRLPMPIDDSCAQIPGSGKVLPLGK